VGAFNLVRRSAFEKTDGFEWLKLEITDDWALGMLIKQSGGQVSLVNGRNLIRVIWYPGIREMTVGLEKGAYSALGNFSFRRTMFWSCMFLAVEMSPLLAILTFGAPLLQLLGTAAWLIALATSIRMTRWTNGPFFPAILFPVGTIIFSGILMRAAWLGWRRDGVVWRGTYYSEDLLRSGKRFSLP
jgi:cellulose synthase/poly-beta-1,6-N-acetylglucosamine synthase-like glycosyltransferase